jgi:hypothetical protein
MVLQASINSIRFIAGAKEKHNEAVLYFSTANLQIELEFEEPALSEACTGHG